MSDSNTAVLEETMVRTSKAPEEKSSAKHKPPKQQPRYNVILWDDPDHTFEYVIGMMKDLFAYSKERGNKFAKEVDSSGRAICLTTTKEHAELKQEQIQAFGKDPTSAKSKGSMSASIEPVE